MTSYELAIRKDRDRIISIIQNLISSSLCNETKKILDTTVSTITNAPICNEKRMLNKASFNIISVKKTNPVVDWINVHIYSDKYTRQKYYNKYVSSVENPVKKKDFYNVMESLGYVEKDTNTKRIWEKDESSDSDESDSDTQQNYPEVKDTNHTQDNTHYDSIITILEKCIPEEKKGIFFVNDIYKNTYVPYCLDKHKMPMPEDRFICECKDTYYTTEECVALHKQCPYMFSYRNKMANYAEEKYEFVGKYGPSISINLANTEGLLYKILPYIEQMTINEITLEQLTSLCLLVTSYSVDNADNIKHMLDRNLPEIFEERYKNEILSNREKILELYVRHLVKKYRINLFDCKPIMNYYRDISIESVDKLSYDLHNYYFIMGTLEVYEHLYCKDSIYSKCDTGIILIDNILNNCRYTAKRRQPLDKTELIEIMKELGYEISKDGESFIGLALKSNSDSDSDSDSDKKVELAGIVYLIQPSECKDNYYKVGMSKSLTLKRIKSYGKDCKILCVSAVVDPVAVEKKLKAKLTKKYKLIKGNEYFACGDVHDIIQTFHKVVHS